MAEETLAQTILAMREKIDHEMAHGGDREPCPFCGVPRCQRSDYIRCMQCGINWLDGEDLSRDPYFSRELYRTIESQKAKSSPGKDGKVHDRETCQNPQCAECRAEIAAERVRYGRKR